MGYGTTSPWFSPLICVRGEVTQYNGNRWTTRNRCKNPRAPTSTGEPDKQEKRTSPHEAGTKRKEKRERRITRPRVQTADPAWPGGGLDYIRRPRWRRRRIQVHHLDLDSPATAHFALREGTNKAALARARAAERGLSVSRLSLLAAGPGSPALSVRHLEIDYPPRALTWLGLFCRLAGDGIQLCGLPLAGALAPVHRERPQGPQPAAANHGVHAD
ncbi:hypothetical protein B0T16DRAFT_107843 [Cercophora newfieldiana]|uniref:Uncharacterized protein n=1 Tax=Cercophora newfieldiana TaxID=92897 RepID=A0AA39YHV6_9PEZI|nr:hypothetical protein B0T16DRAFT_107843 [Cercophora newfieldiana]